MLLCYRCSRLKSSCSCLRVCCSTALISYLSRFEFVTVEPKGMPNLGCVWRNLCLHDDYPYLQCTYFSQLLILCIPTAEVNDQYPECTCITCSAAIVSIVFYQVRLDVVLVVHTSYFADLQVVEIRLSILHLFSCRSHLQVLICHHIFGFSLPDLNLCYYSYWNHWLRFSWLCSLPTFSNQQYNFWVFRHFVLGHRSFKQVH